MILALAGEEQACYKIIVTKSDHNLTGDVLGGRPSPGSNDSVKGVPGGKRRNPEWLSRSRLAAAQERTKDEEQDRPANPMVSRHFQNFSGVDSKGKALPYH